MNYPTENAFITFLPCAGCFPLGGSVAEVLRTTRQTTEACRKVAPTRSMAGLVPREEDARAWRRARKGGASG